MTTFRNINDTEVAVDAPLTQQLMQALKDNVLSIQEGDSTAPRLQLVLNESHTTPTAGDNVILGIDLSTLTQGEDFTATIKFRIAGTYRVRTRLACLSDSGNSDNGTNTLEKSTNDGTGYSTVRTLNTDGRESATGSDDVTFSSSEITSGARLRINITAQSNVSVSGEILIAVADNNAPYGLHARRILD